MSLDHNPPIVILASPGMIYECRRQGLVALADMLTPHTFDMNPASRAPDPARHFERDPWTNPNRSTATTASWTQLRDRKQARRRA